MMSDLPCEEVQRLGCCFRNHWGIENRLHWVLDVSFGEDGNRTRRGNGAENLGKLRRLVHGLLLKVKGKQTVPKTMFRAALSPDYRNDHRRTDRKKQKLMRQPCIPKGERGHKKRARLSWLRYNSTF